MSFLFGGPVAERRTPANPVRDMQSQMRDSMRALMRESRKANEQEKKLVVEIKHYAQLNRLQLVQVKAKELIRLRAHQEKLQTTHCSLSSLHQSLSSIASTQIMQETITKTSKLLKSLNQSMSVHGIMKAMHEYQSQHEQFATKQENLNETIDEVMKDENEDAATSDAVSDVLQELGLDASLVLARVPLAPLSDQQLASRLKALQAPL